MTLKHKRLAEEWFERAESDLLYARAGERETGRHSVTCFLGHQVVEKVLKGFIVGAGQEPPRTHNLRLLLSKVKGLYPKTTLKEDDARRLEGYYIPTRYPGPAERDLTAEDAQTAIEIAGRFFEATRALD